MKNIIEVDNLCFSYQKRKILNNICFKLTAGEFISIIGPNGAGKTTLLNLLTGFLKPDSGQITIDDKNIKSYKPKTLAKKIAVVSQNSSSLFDFSARQIVEMGRAARIGSLGLESQIDTDAIEQAMSLTNTIDFSNRPISQLSGGERQRVFIARAFAQQSPIIMLDEPTNFLDIKNQIVICDLLKQMQQDQKKTILSITHDINLAVQYSDTTLVLSKDREYLYGKSESILSTDNIQTMFDVKIIATNFADKTFYIPQRAPK